MKAGFAVCTTLLVLAGCTSVSSKDKSGNDAVVPDLVVTQASDSRKVADAIPAGSAMERFETLDAQGRLISYVAFTDTDTGALVFVNRKLSGVLSHHDAQAFYSCRGYSTNAASHWAHDAAEWTASLLESTKPATEVKLKFSGKSTTQSIREVADNPFLKGLKSIFSAGSSPLGMIGSLNSARGDMESSADFEKARKGLGAIGPGMSEASVAEVVKPESVAFISGGMVMSYPSHLIEYYVVDGVVRVVQQPSFNLLARTHADVFYVPYVEWALCTPQRWKEALKGKH